jgi:hypothetical protein
VAPTTRHCRLQRVVVCVSGVVEDLEAAVSVNRRDRAAQRSVGSRVLCDLVRVSVYVGNSDWIRGAGERRRKVCARFPQVNRMRSDVPDFQDPCLPQIMLNAQVPLLRARRHKPSRHRKCEQEWCRNGTGTSRGATELSCLCGVSPGPGGSVQSRKSEKRGLAGNEIRIKCSCRRQRVEVGRSPLWRVRWYAVRRERRLIREEH